MTRLTVELAQAMLLEADEVKKATAEKMKKPSVKKGERKAGKDPALSRTTIKQVEVPKTSMPAGKEGSSGIPQADYAKSYTDKMKHGNDTMLTKGGQNQNQKSPKMPKSKSDKPNQETQLKLVKNPIKGTDDDGSQKANFIPQADFAKKYTDKMPHGEKNLKAGNEEGGEGVKKPKVSGLAASKGAHADATTRPKGNTRKAAKLGTDRGTKKVQQIKGPSGFVNDPSDAMARKQKWEKQTGGAHNVVESGVAVKLKGKTKATFEVVSRDVLRKMSESYKKAGYKLKFQRVQPAWKSDRQFLTLIREAVHASQNFAPKYAKAYRKAALTRFRALSQGSYSTLYETRDDFNKTIWDAFRKIEKIAKSRYVEGLEPFEVMARISDGKDDFDIEIMTEATDHQMALRQTYNKLAEAYGLDIDLKHVFVDGTKYVPKDIKVYFPRHRKVIARFTN